MRLFVEAHIDRSRLYFCVAELGNAFHCSCVTSACDRSRAWVFLTFVAFFDAYLICSALLSLLPSLPRNRKAHNTRHTITFTVEQRKLPQMNRSDAATARKAFRPPFKTAVTLLERVQQRSHRPRNAAFPALFEEALFKCSASGELGGVQAAAAAAATDQHCGPQSFSHPGVASLQRAGELESSGDDKGSRNALVGDTLRWIAASQKATQYLADSTANGNVECVLAELHIDPAAVLYSTKEEALVEL